jgi:hypothetical protein
MKRYIVRLTEDGRERLIALITKGKKSSAYKIRHANILLKADADGAARTDERIAEAFSVHKNTVAGIRQCLVGEGFEAAPGRKKQCRPSRKPKFDGETEARLTALRCGSPPEGSGRRTLRLLADRPVEMEIADTVSYETVRQVLKKTG